MRAERLGRYELLRHLASGGMARVFLARVDGVGGFARHLVLKTVRPERTEDASYVAMFLDEARLIATLHHQHVAQVYDVGVADDGTYFLAMEYLHGETVRAVLERARDLRQRLPLDFSLTVVAAAAAGLHHAHERRGPDGRRLDIVHRDVTPSNVITGYDGSVKLIDFGIAKAAERSTQTKTGFIKGKAGYMAPEQALGHPVDRRADVFALGVVLYELTTQTRAFPAASELEVAHRIVRGEVVPPSMAVAGFPAELEDVIMTALARDPDERFGDAAALGHALDYAVSHLGLAPGPNAVTRVMAQLFGSRPEPWLVADAPEVDENFTHTGDTASLLESRPLLATSSVAVGFARGTGAQDPIAKLAARPASTIPKPAEVVDDDLDGDEIPTVKFLALDEAEIIIELAPARAVRVAPGASAGRTLAARTLVPLPGLTEPSPGMTASPPLASPALTVKPLLPPIPPPPIPPPPPPLPRAAAGSQPPPFEAPSFPAFARVLPPPPVSVGVRTEAVTALGVLTARRRWILPLVAGAATAALVIVALVVLINQLASSPGVDPAAPAAAIATPPPAVRTEVAAPALQPELPRPIEASTIAVRVTTTPPDATVMLGGERLGRTPLTSQRSRRTGKAWLKVRKRGYSARKIQVDLDADVTWEIALPRSP